MAGKLLKIAAPGVLILMVTVHAGAAGSLHVQRITVPGSEPGLQYSCSYPRVEGIQNEQNQQLLNVKLKEKAQTAQGAAALAYRQYPDKTTTGKFDFEVKRNRDGMLSMKLTSTLTRNGRSTTALTGVSVDTVSGRMYTLGDLFFDGADYTGALQEKIEKQIQSGRQNGRIGGTKISPYEEFYLTDDSLVVILGRPGLAEDRGVQEFAIPLQSLEGYLKPSLRLSS